MRTIIGAQGEVMIFRIDGDMPASVRPLVDRDRAGRPIIGHSESGHHHVLDRPVEVFEATDAPAGMRVLYALLTEPTAVVQDAGTPHAPHMLEPGIYEFRIAREFDPFAEAVRRVAD